MHLEVDKDSSLTTNNLQLENINDAIIEYKRILQFKRKGGLLALKDLKKVFLITLHHKINTSHIFITATASNNCEVKQMGYLGMQMEPNESHSIFLINTLGKDLSNEKVRTMAINFIGNMCKRYPLFNDLLTKVNVYDNKLDYLPREIIAYYAVNPVNKNIRIVEITAKRLFVKLQILIDDIRSVLDNNIICDNDLEYLKSIAMKTKDINLLIKIFQFLRMCKISNEEQNSKAFNEFVESKIINGSIKHKDLLYLALSLEASEYLLSASYNSINAHGFIFRLVKAEDDYLNSCAYRLITQYKIHDRIAIHRLLECGVKDDESLNKLLSLINMTNCNDLYDLKIKCIQSMEAKNAKKEVIENIWDKIFLKILQVCDNSLKFKILTENIHLHKSINFNRDLDESICVDLYDHLNECRGIESFQFLYKIITVLKYNNLNHIYESHLAHILDQFVIETDDTNLKPFTAFIDCIYNNEIIYFTHSFIYCIKEKVLETNNQSLIKTHENYCEVIESMLSEKYERLHSGEFIYYTSRIIEGIKRHVKLIYLNNYVLDLASKNDYFLINKVENVWTETTIEMYDFEADTLAIKIIDKDFEHQDVLLKLK